MNTVSFIHIIGPQGAGKTRLARDIVAGLRQRGKSAIALMDHDLGPPLEGLRPADFELLRKRGMRPPFTQREWGRFDVMIAEHLVDLPDGLVLQQQDLVLRIEHPRPT